MITQTAISLKLDTDQLQLFDELCAKLGTKRNKMLNFLVFYANQQLKDVEKLNILRAYSGCFI